MRNGSASRSSTSCAGASAAAARSRTVCCSPKPRPAAKARLEALLETNDGFALADKDLEIRGEGQVIGSRQAGVPDLKLARLVRDRDALLRARELAAGLLAADPGLASPINAPLKDAVDEAFGDELGWLLRA